MADENTIDKLQIEIDATAKNSSKGLDKLVNSLNNLKNSLGSNLSGLTTLATSLSALNSSASGLKSASSGMNALANSAKRLVGVDFSMLAEQFGRLSKATKSVGDMSQQAGYLKEFANSINSFRRGMEKIQAARLEGLSTKIKQLVTAIRPLTNEMIRAGAGMSNFGEQMKYLAQASNTALRVQNKMKQNSSSVKNNPFFGGGFKLVNFAAAIYMVRRLGSAIAGTIKNINSYVENMNLFSVAMGKYAESGQEFANVMQSNLGVDAGEVMRNMGLFMQLSTSFGIAGEQANVLSKNLTQLGYDIASFFNISVEESFTKLTSGIAGEIEPLRRIGIDISQARLEMELYNLGIKANISDLSQADKSLLRYIAIMKQTTNVQGDMGRTIMTPANALRVLEAQLQIAGRAIGSIFIPALLQILPIAIAVVRVIGDLARAFASLLGFEMPVIDYSSLNSITLGADSATDGLDDVTDSAKSAKKAVSALIGGFDELNVLNKDTGSKDGVLGNLLGGIQLPEYDMLAGLVQTSIDETTAKMRKWFDDNAKPVIDDIATILKPIAAALKDIYKEIVKPLLSWWGGIIIDWLGKLADWVRENPDTAEKIAKGALLIYGGFKTWKLLTGVGKWLSELGAIRTLSGGLRTLYNRIFGVNDIMGKKNKTLGNQTKLTDNETGKVLGLASAFGLAALGAGKLKKWLDENPLKIPKFEMPGIPSLNPQPVLAPAIAPAINMETLYKPSLAEYLKPIQAPIFMTLLAPFINLLNFNKSKIEYGQDVKAPNIIQPIAPIIDFTSNFNPSLEKAKIDVGTFSLDMQTSFSTMGKKITSNMKTVGENMGLNFNKALEYMNSVTPVQLASIARSFGTFLSVTSSNMALWGNNTASNYQSVMNYFPKASSTALSSAGLAFNGFLSTTSSNTAIWGNSMVKNIGLTMQGFYTNFVSGLSSAWDAFKKFMEATGEKISKMWSANKNWVIPVGITLAAVGGLAAVALSGGTLAPAMGALMPAMAAIPALADGGVLYDNTVVRVGEYANANNNPEIVTPQNIMYDTVAEATAEGFVAIVQAIHELKSVVKEKDTCINLDGEKIANNTIGHINDTTRRNGESPIII